MGPRVVETSEVAQARIYEGMAHSFWTGEEARRSWERNEHAGGNRAALAKLLRLAQGNGHMLTAIFTLVRAQVPAEIECPDCGATIRAPHAGAVEG